MWGRQEERRGHGGTPPASISAAQNVVEPPPLFPCPAPPFGWQPEGQAHIGGWGGGYASPAFQELLTLCDRASRVLWRSPDLILSRVAVMVSAQWLWDSQ